MNTKVKKILNKTANVLAIIIGIFVLLIAISSISASVGGRGYPSLFGYSAYAVKTDSMKGDKSDSFNKGDLIIVKLLDSVQKAELTEGKVITFYDMIGGVKELNTHRIVEVYNNGTAFETKGDNAPDKDSQIGAEDIVGVYSSKIPVIGNLILFTQSPDGFLALIVVPSVLVVLYCSYLLFKNLRDFSKEKRKQDLEEMKKKLLEEMKNKENGIDNNQE